MSADEAVVETPRAPAGRNMDGYAYPYTEEKGTYLVVVAPQGDGKPVDYGVVERELKKLNIEGLDWEHVRQAVAAATGKPKRILHGVDPDEEAAKAAAAEAERLANAPVDKSPFVYLTLTDDLVSAKLTLVPPEVEKNIELNMADVQKVIDEQHIVFGLNEDGMAEAEEILEKIQEGVWTEPVELEIAHGIDPQPGQDTQYEFFFDQTTKAAAKAKAVAAGDQRVDYFAVKEIENTKRGQAIARRIPPTKGIPGKSIRGEEIAAQDGQEGAITIGVGVEHALGNENILVASVDGQVKFADNTLEVRALYEIKGDVDLSTGSIDFIGSVVVRGNVQPGLKITAKEDVIVDGVIDDAEIHTDGSLIVKGGILGQGGKAKVFAKGDVSAKYIRNATIESKGTVKADEGVLHSHVTAFAVKLTGKRGMIVGGEIVAETDIVANTIGSNTVATPTILVVGENPERRNKINSLTEQVQKMEENLDKAQKNSVALKQLQERTGTLPPDRKEMLIKLTRLILKTKNDLKPMQEELQQILAEEEEQRKQHPAKIAVAGTMYPGVKVTIRNAKKHIVDEMRYCTLIEKGSEIKVGSFK